MSTPFRFSHRPNRAADISWREWGEAAFAEAASLDRLVLLYLTAVWCHWCHRMDETTWSDPGVAQRLNRDFVAIRVDADRLPHVQDRYIAGGWPTTAFLTPTGEVLWAGTYTEPAQLLALADGVLRAWRERRGELETEMERRRRSVEAQRARQRSAGLVRREAADDVLTAVCDGFDARNGGVGPGPKFPQPEVVELLYLNAPGGNPALAEMADRTLDGMLAGELLDPVDGGFFRYALAADWTDPRREKLLDVNAGLLAAYALGASVRGRADWSEIAAGIVAWVQRTLARPDGLWGGSQAADETYFTAPAKGRSAQPAPPVDTTLYTSANARWIAALAFAGGRLRLPEWSRRAERALEQLLGTMAAPGDLLHHYCDPAGSPELPTLLLDVVETARACLAVHQATGSTAALQHARRLARAMEQSFWAGEGGFFDRVRSDQDVGALRYRDQPFELNAQAARVLLDLASATAERGWRAHAERVLATLSPHAGRWGAAGATFAIAVEEYFQPTMRTVIVGDPAAATPLREAALALPLPGHRVWTMPQGGRLDALSFPAEPAPAAYVCTPRGRSPAIVADGELQPALARLL